MACSVKKGMMMMMMMMMIIIIIIIMSLPRSNKLRPVAGINYSYEDHYEKI
jgi:hypothetical protein